MNDNNAAKGGNNFPSNGGIMDVDRQWLHVTNSVCIHKLIRINFRKIIKNYSIDSFFRYRSWLIQLEDLNLELSSIKNCNG